MKKKKKTKKKVDQKNSLTNDNDLEMNVEKPRYTGEEISFIKARFEQHAEAKKLFPEFFGDKYGEFIIIDEEPDP